MNSGMAIMLALCELVAFYKQYPRTTILLDTKEKEEVYMNFNLTFHRLECESIAVHVWDQIGMYKQAVLNDIRKVVGQSARNSRVFRFLWIKKGGLRNL